MSLQPTSQNCQVENQNEVTCYLQKVSGVKQMKIVFNNDITGVVVSVGQSVGKESLSARQKSSCIWESISVHTSTWFSFFLCTLFGGEKEIHFIRSHIPTPYDGD